MNNVSLQGICKMIIALCGKRRVGKDVVAAHLVSAYGMQHMKIAHKLKEACSIMFGFSKEQLENDEKDAIDTRWGVTPRQVMQFVGTELMQHKIQELIPDVGRLLWVKSLCAELDKKSVVISDVRFVHEVQELKRHGAYIIKIHSDRMQCQETVDHHISETESELVQADFVVKNNGTIDDLHCEIDRIMASIQT